MSGHSKGNSPAAAEARFAAALNIGANAWAPQSVAQRCALFALRLYKTYLSVFVGGSCRFQPTCSIYAYEAVERFGVARGAWLALKRLLRCHPLSRKFGFDPVPDATHPSVAVTPEEAHS